MALGNKKKLPWWRSKYVLWGFIMLPGILLSISLLRGNMEYKAFMHASGELSARFLFLSLIASPLAMLFPKGSFPKWLTRNKRYFGLAAFAYALYHGIVYLVEVPASQVAQEFFEIGLLTAWVSFLIWIPMAITSTDGWVLRLKSTWKKIHNWGYLAALLAFVHWALIHYHWKPALVHATPLIILQGYRWWVVFKRKKKN